MGQIKRTLKNIFIDNIPEGLSKAQKVSILDHVENTTGEWTGDYADIVWGDTKEGEETVSSTPAPEEAETTFKGGIDAVTRELGPLMAAGAAGAAAGSVVPGVGTLTGGAMGMAAYGITEAATPMITKILNNKFGTNQVDARTGWTAIFDSLGLDSPDTKAEQIIASGARGIAEAVKFLSGGQLLKTGEVALEGPTMAQQTGQLIAQAPAQQIVGEGVSGMGAEGASQVAEDQDMGPIGSMLLTMGGAIVGDLTGSGIMNMADAVKKLMVADNMSMPAATKEILDRAKRGGVDVYRSDITPATRRGEDARNTREATANGLRDFRFERQAPQRQQMTSELVDSFVDTDLTGTNLGRFEDHLEASAQEFLETRGAAHMAAKDKKWSVISAHGAEQVPTSNTEQYVNETLKELEKIDDIGHRRLEKQLVNWQDRYAAASDGDKSLGTLEELRKGLGDLFKGDGTLPSSKEQEVIKGMYASLNKDMGDFLKAADPKGMEFAKWRDANAELATLMDDFNIKGISDMLTDKDVSADTLGNLLFSADTQKLENAFSRLPSGSQAKARDAFTGKLVNDSTVRGEMSASKFMDILDTNKGRYETLFGENAANLENVFTGFTPEVQKTFRSSFMSEMAEAATDNNVISPNKLVDLLDSNKDVTKVIFDEGQTSYVEGVKAILRDTSRAEVDKLAKDMFPGEGLPGGSYMLSRIISQNPVVAIPVLLGAKVGKGSIFKHLESDAGLRDLFIKYDQIPASNKNFRAETAKRIGEQLKSYIIAEENKNKKQGVE